MKNRTGLKSTCRRLCSIGRRASDAITFLFGTVGAVTQKAERYRCLNPGGSVSGSCLLSQCIRKLHLTSRRCPESSLLGLGLSQKTWSLLALCGKNLACLKVIAVLAPFMAKMETNKGFRYFQA